MKARDEIIGWTSTDRKNRLVHLMDAFVLGALPPYNMLLGGKLVACLVRTTEVANLFSERYAETVGIISGKAKRASPSYGNDDISSGKVFSVQPPSA